MSQAIQPFAHRAPCHARERRINVRPCSRGRVRMAQDRRTWSALAALLPAGTMGLSISLASADAKATATGEPEAKKPGAVHERLDSIRRTVSTIVNETPV